MMSTRNLALLATAIALLLAAFTAWRSYQASPAAPEDIAELQEMRELSIQSMQDTLSDRLAATTTGESQERLDSPLGLALFRKCSEWTEFNTNHPSDNAAQNEQTACGEYRAYVNDGTLPAGHTEDTAQPD